MDLEEGYNRIGGYGSLKIQEFDDNELSFWLRIIYLL